MVGPDSTRHQLISEGALQITTDADGTVHGKTQAHTTVSQGDHELRVVDLPSVLHRDEGCDYSGCHRRL